MYFQKISKVYWKQACEALKAEPLLPACLSCIKVVMIKKDHS